MFVRVVTLLLKAKIDISLRKKSPLFIQKLLISVISKADCAMLKQVSTKLSNSFLGRFNLSTHFGLIKISFCDN